MKKHWQKLNINQQKIIKVTLICAYVLIFIGLFLSSLTYMQVIVIW